VAAVVVVVVIAGGVRRSRSTRIDGYAAFLGEEVRKFSEPLPRI
jgi:hypothetical protein